MTNQQKQFVQEEDLLNDAYRLAVKIFESGFRPDFIVGIWRGGSTVGIYVQECLQYLGVETDHIAIRTSYRGMDDYLKKIDAVENIRVHGLKYLYENLNRDDKLLIVDDVFGTGKNVSAVINRLEDKLKRNMPEDVRLAMPYYKPSKNKSNRKPDYYLHETDQWLVLPYELTGLSVEEIQKSKAWMMPILEQCKASSG
ncbi:MAG: phosphoribosyltransferase family protein [Pseudomonadales bacterium]|jgi:hypoxanthine phosphoribosyltransferase|nr:phosphoribosyltransferase family protein [Pseudomonadales bacterium]MDG1442721.1 phosphoribosyltransferase family protein [Pseudomonadales bacterium]